MWGLGFFTGVAAVVVTSVIMSNRAAQRSAGEPSSDERLAEVRKYLDQITISISLSNSQKLARKALEKLE